MVFPQCPTVKRSARNSGAAIAGRVCYTTASSAAALGHLGAAHKRGSGAKMARSREEFGLRIHQTCDETAFKVWGRAGCRDEFALTPPSSRKSIANRRWCSQVSLPQCRRPSLRAAPMPDAAPEMMATLPASLIAYLPFWRRPVRGLAHKLSHRAARPATRCGNDCPACTVGFNFLAVPRRYLSAMKDKSDMAEYGEWNRKGAVLSDVTAQKEYGVTRDFIVKGIQAGELEFREGAVWGNPYLRILRRQLEQYIVARLGSEYLASKKSHNELRAIHKEIAELKKKLAVLEARKAALEYEIKT
jgi:hypothetical protein